MHCEAHRRPADVPIGAGVVFTRLTFDVRVDMAAAPGLGHAGAVDAAEILRAALRAIGATIRIVDTTSQTCRYLPERRRRDDFASGGKG